MVPGLQWIASMIHNTDMPKYEIFEEAIVDY